MIDLQKTLENLRVHSEDEEQGRIYIDHEDVLYISASSLLSKYEDKSGLLAWRKRKGEAVANQLSQEAATRGNLAHKELEHYLEFGTEPVSSFTKQSLSFYAHVDMVAVEEQIVFSDGKVRFAGRFDQLVSIPSGKFRVENTEDVLSEKKVICDLKTKTRAPNLTMDVIFKNLLQGAAYVVAKEILSQERLDGLVLVYASPRTSKTIYLNREDLEYYWEVYYGFLEDYYGIKPLARDWNYYKHRASMYWNDTLKTFEDKLPVFLHKAD